VLRMLESIAASQAAAVSEVETRADMPAK